MQKDSIQETSNKKGVQMHCFGTLEQTWENQSAFRIKTSEGYKEQQEGTV